MYEVQDTTGVKTKASWVSVIALHNGLRFIYLSMEQGSRNYEERVIKRIEKIRRRTCWCAFFIAKYTYVLDKHAFFFLAQYHSHGCLLHHIVPHK
jgi:hypothetical protein